MNKTLCTSLISMLKLLMAFPIFAKALRVLYVHNFNKPTDSLNRKKRQLLKTIRINYPHYTTFYTKKANLNYLRRRYA